METTKSLDDNYEVIAALLCDISNAHGTVFNTRSLKCTLEIVHNRLLSEGMGFLTKTLPRLGKALDRALVEGRLVKANWAQKSQKGEILTVVPCLVGSELPMFMGEFFKRIFELDGVLLATPCVNSVKVLRQVLYVYYKYELPYTEDQELQVLARFTETEQELSTRQEFFRQLEDYLVGSDMFRSRAFEAHMSTRQVALEAKRLLAELFSSFDPLHIHPRHGPGAVATKQQLQRKYLWTNVAAKITDVYPFDAYFCASFGEVCDRIGRSVPVGEANLPARVILVPKDSRGPRLISCEPVDYQWVQQGLGRAIVEHVELHPLTRESVRFTDQGPNRNVALLASRDGQYSTLDLNEASDRVHLELVRLLWPENLWRYLEACRSSSTVLPNGKIQQLTKFAPMGSALCFPIMAVTIWAILSAAAPNADVQEHIYVYGDDVIVPTAQAADAIEHLESFGLKINRDKSCTTGLFRESCGMDAFKGTDVTPVRLRTVWSLSRSPEIYLSWIAYANSFRDRGYYHLYDLIVERLRHYGPIPSEDMHLACPSLRYLPESEKPTRRRWNPDHQVWEYLVLDVKFPRLCRQMNGWSMLLRFFSEAGSDRPLSHRPEYTPADESFLYGSAAFSVRLYTERSSGMLELCWR